MPRKSIHNDWDDDEPSWGDDAEGDAESDAEDDDYTVPCPFCKRPIHEDAQRCPYCEHYISEEDSPPQRKPWWIVVGAVVGLYVVYRWIMG
jgi:hypothetical protein